MSEQSIHLPKEISQGGIAPSSVPIVHELFVYPIKSCAGISVSQFHLDHRGPIFDRRWMLVDAKTGIFLSQREIPKMALITTVIEGDSVWAGILGNEKAIKLSSDGPEVDVSIWSDDVQGLDCGDDAARWFSTQLEHECRLIFQGHCARLADTEYAESGTAVSYADGFPLLVVSLASIQLLNTQCDANIAAENFRPNIVVKNTEAFAEINWQRLVTDSISMNVVKPCERCIIPALNPKTGVRERDILPVLIKHCRKDKKIYFGQNLTFKARDKGTLSAPLNGPLMLQVGQEVEISVDA